MSSTGAVKTDLDNKLELFIEVSRTFADDYENVTDLAFHIVKGTYAPGFGFECKIAKLKYVFETYIQLVQDITVAKQKGKTN